MGESTKQFNQEAVWKYGKSLAIVVPYRDREAHLKQFIPHLKAYFARDKLDCRIEHTVHIVEQSSGQKFNRGKLKNCGFQIARADHEYFCFHDVDYLPIWADYSYSGRPTRLIWHGLTLAEDYDSFFGGVILFNKEDFLKTNGYSNRYWGWGFEDVDLLARCHTLGLGFDKRDGTFISLGHAHGGIGPDGQLTEEARETRDSFEANQVFLQQGGFRYKDGLSDLHYTCNSSRKIADRVFMHRVSI